MSSIHLLKDHGTAKKGDVISVSFGEGKRLIAEKIGIYPSQPKQIVQPVIDPEKEAMRAEIAAKQKQIDELLEASTAPVQTNIVDPLKKK